MQATAAVLHEPSASESFPDDLDLEFEEITVDEPTGQEVLVEIQAASLCHTDISIAKGERDETFPQVMGHEGAGIVRDVGDDVKYVSPGDHVVLGRTACRRCEYCRQGKPQLCNVRRETTSAGTLRTGKSHFSKDGEPRYHCHGVSSFSEYTLVTEEVATPIHPDLPFEQATLLGCGVFTGFGAVDNSVDVETGSTVAVFGAGGVGLSAIQAASLNQAREVIAIDLLADKLSLAEELGATETVDASAEDPVQRVRELTGGVDFAVEAVGYPEVIGQAIRSLGKTGTAVLVGTPPGGLHDVSFDMHDLILSEKSIVGAFNGSYDLQSAIPTLSERAVNGNLRLEPLVSSTRQLDDLREAMRSLEEGSELRQVLVP